MCLSCGASSGVYTVGHSRARQVRARAILGALASNGARYARCTGLCVLHDRAIAPVRIALLVALALAAGCTPDDGEAAAADHAALSDRDALDPRFGDRGLAIGDDVPNDATTSMAFDDRDRLLVAWSRYDGDERLRITRLRTDGTEDPTYGRGAKIPLLLPPLDGQLAVQPLWDGSAIVAATALCALSSCPFDPEAPGRTTNVVFKLDSAGDVDRGFPMLSFGEGTRSLKIARARDNEVVVSIDGDGRRVELVWIAGTGAVTKRHEIRDVPGATISLAANEGHAYVGRAGFGRSSSEPRDFYGLVAGISRETGARTTDFGPISVTEPRGAVITKVSATASTILVAGHADVEGFGTGKVYVTKLDADLIPDVSFGRSGTKVFAAGDGGGGRLTDMRVLANGKILLAGSIEADGIWRHEGALPGSDDDLGLVLLRRDGSFDESFGKRGRQLVHAGDKNDALLTLSKKSNELYAAGFAGRRTAVAKLLPR